MFLSSYLAVQGRYQNFVRSRFLCRNGVQRQCAKGSGRGGGTACRCQAHLGTGHLDQDLGTLYLLESMSKHLTLSRNLIL